MRAFAPINVKAIQDPYVRAAIVALDIYSRQTATAFKKFVSVPVNPPSPPAGGGGGVTDHGALTGLLDDDHPQYMLVAGTRAFTGEVGGIDPTSATHLATKNYVDTHTYTGTIAESQISNDAILARIADGELITGGWTFTLPTVQYASAGGIFFTIYDVTDTYGMNLKFSGAASGGTGTIAFPWVASGTKTVYVTGGTDVAVADGGTGASTAAAARVALLPSLTGNSLKVLRSNVGETDVEWATVSGTGTVTSVDVSGGTTGLTSSGGPVTTSGTITLAGTLVVGNGGTGATTFTANGVLLGNTTSAIGVTALGAANTVLRGTGAAPTFGAIDHNYLSNRTRSIFYAANQWHVHATGAATDIGSFPDVTYTMEVADGQTGGGHVTMQVPQDYASGATLKVVWAPTTTNTGNCRIEADYLVLGAGILIDAAGTVINVDSAANGTAKASQTSTVGSMTVAAGDIVRVAVRRQGGHANDTFTGACDLIGFIFEYTADM